MSLQSILFNRGASKSDKKRDAAIPLPEGVVECRNISYGSHGKWNLLDVYYPQGTNAPLPTIVSIHGGEEKEYKPTKDQIKYCRGAVDAGADLVLGHHPHVINGIETYKGVKIVYSLANFCFGGNKNPDDKDTFIFQQAFVINADGTLTPGEINVIPCSVSSVTVSPAGSSGTGPNTISSASWS